MNKTLIITMGGKSSRMGEDKCGLVLKGRTIFERILGNVEPYFDEIILSSNNPGKCARFDLPVVTDEVPGLGPAGGLLSVMNAYPRDYYQVVPCDAPFMEGEVVARVLEMSQGYDVGFVRTPDGPQPLFSAYSIAARDAFRDGVGRGMYRVAGCIEGLNILEITVDQLGLDDRWEKLFFNINRPGDLERAIDMDEM